MKTHPAFVTLCVVLAGSALLNVILLSRTSEPAMAPPRASAWSPAKDVAPGDPPPTVAAPIPPPAELPPAPGAPPRTAFVPPRAGIRFDPAVEAVLDAQERFGGFWKDLERVFKAKDRLEEARFFQAVVGATQDFLELAEPARTQFALATQAGISELMRARKDRDDARSLLPPKDKANLAAYAAYQQQKDAVDARYDERVAAAVARVTALLDPSRPRHAEFSASAERWLRYQVPTAKPQ